MNRNYRHPLHETIAGMIRDGGADRGISTQLGVDRRTVRRVRRILAAPAYSAQTSMNDKLAAYSTEPDAEGHVLWTGSLMSNGSPRMRHLGVDVPVSHVVFEQRTGRKPQGHVKADCGVEGCIAPRHVIDDIERRSNRLALRPMMGFGQHWMTCRKCGGDWDTYGRVEKNLTLYCTRCVSDRARRNRARKEAA